MSDGNYAFYLIVAVLLVVLGLWKGGELLWRLLGWIF